MIFLFKGENRVFQRESVKIWKEDIFYLILVGSIVAEKGFT